MVSNKRKLSSYDKEILAPLKIMKWMLGIYIAVNLFVPLYSPMRIGAVRFYNYLNIIFMIIGVVGAHGIFKQRVPALPVTLVRFVQFMLVFVKAKELLLIPFIGLVAYDLLFIFYLMADRAKFCYEESEE